MKTPQSIWMLGFAAVFALVWFVSARGEDTAAAGRLGPIASGASGSRPRAAADVDSPAGPSGHDAGAVEALRKLDAATEKVRGRLRMSAMLEAGVDPAMDAEIEEFYRSGWIIDATVDEVESALEAAAATPSTEDDVKAQILAHRASCRFFVTE